MQKVLHFVMSLLIIISFMSSCTNPSTSTFNNKEDSLKFARAVYQIYADDFAGETIDTAWLPGEKGVHPISWDTVQSYQDFYDKEPKILDPNKQPYKGFSIDPNGYAWIKKNKIIRGLYLRLGRKGDGSYTIMLLGTDSLGKIIQKKSLRSSTGGTAPDPSNFDNTIPCPDQCPVDPD